jgi:RNase P subunit RPR2
MAKIPVDYEEYNELKEREEKLTRIASIAKEMREAQRKYFKLRNQVDLRLSVRLERELDEALKALE